MCAQRRENLAARVIHEAYQHGSNIRHTVCIPSPEEASCIYIPPSAFFFFLSVMPFSFLGVSVVHNFFFPLALYVHKGLARENKGQQTCIILMYYMY